MKEEKSIMFDGKPNLRGRICIEAGSRPHPIWNDLSSNEELENSDYRTKAAVEFLQRVRPNHILHGVEYDLKDARELLKIADAHDPQKIIFSYLGRPLKWLGRKLGVKQS